MIKEAIKGALEVIKEIQQILPVKRLIQKDLKQKTASTACYYYRNIMVISYMTEKDIDPNEVYDMLLKKKCINEASAKVLNNDTFAKALGLNKTYKNSKPNPDKMIELLKQNIPLLGSFDVIHKNGDVTNHAMVISGYTKYDDELLFLITDPDKYKSDTHLDPKTWKSFRQESDKRVIVSGAGSTRKLSSFGWFA